MDNATFIKTEKKKYFASVMWRFMVGLAVILAMQLIITIPEAAFFSVLKNLSEKGVDMPLYESLRDSGFIDTFQSIFTYFVLLLSDGLGALVFFLLTKNMRQVPEKGNMKFGWWFAAFITCFGIGGVGAIIGGIVHAICILPGSILSALISAAGSIVNSLTSTNVVDSLIYANDSWFYLICGILTVGIIAPFLEELIFRKIFIDASSKYGFGASILLSALAFGIFHFNFQQFFYAVGLGILFGYVYASTGKLRYTVFFHMGYNLYSSMVLPLCKKMISPRTTKAMTMYYDSFMNNVDLNPSLALELYGKQTTNYFSAHPFELIGPIAVLCAYLFYFVLIGAGIIVAICCAKKALNHRKTMILGQKGTKRCAAGNWASILFFVLGGLIFATYYLLTNLGVAIVGIGT